MRQNVGTEDRIVRSLAGPALMAIGYTQLTERQGRTTGLAALAVGGLIAATAITKYCPLNATLGVDTRRRYSSRPEVKDVLRSPHDVDPRRQEVTDRTARAARATAPDSVVNFGGNVRFAPRHRYAPRNEADVLAILNEHAGERIRAIGSLHSWSDVAATGGVMLDMRHFDQVQVEWRGAEVWATVGAGCRLEDLLPSLDQQGGVTLPTVPAVTTQTIAGAVSTGTHGSGMPSMSHFIEAVRAAAYDPETGRAQIYEWTDGPELRAARCGLGCMGILLSVRFRCVSNYSVLQSVSRVRTIEAALASEGDFPLQQTILIPYAWEYWVYRRRAIHDQQLDTTGIAYLFRAHWWVIVDVLFHVGLVPLVNWVRSRRLIRWYLKEFTPLMLWEAPPHVDSSADVLVLEHELFEHLEMELIVPSRHIREAAKLLREITLVFAGEAERVSPRREAQLEEIRMLDMLYQSRGTYFHHYPILIRRILPDDTLISMTSATTEPYYSVSVFTYYRDKSRLFPLAHFLALSMNQLYGARLHWGKHIPLTSRQIESLYPGLEEFRQICRRVDPNGVFRNRFTERVLGLSNT